MHVNNKDDAAGYPFDIPDPGASIWTYAALSYHLPLMIAFSISQHISFVWGGCMLFRHVALTDNTYGILQVCADSLTADYKCNSPLLSAVNACKLYNTC